MFPFVGGNAEAELKAVRIVSNVNISADLDCQHLFDQGRTKSQFLRAGDKLSIDFLPLEDDCPS